MDRDRDADRYGKGKCDYIEKGEVDPKYLFYSIGFGLPAIIIIVSYFIIWKTTLKSSSFLKVNLNHTSPPSPLNQKHFVSKKYVLVAFRNLGSV